MSRKIIIIICIIAALAVSLAVLNAKRGAVVAPAAGGAKPVSLSGILSAAKSCEAKGNLQGALAGYQRLINEFPGSPEVMNWQKKCESINMQLLFSPAITPKSMVYEIRPGDNLTKIAREFKTTPELIIKSNNLAGDKIIPGRKIKVWAAPFNIFVDKSQNILLLKSDDEIIKAYIVSTGKNNSTPTGNFKITNKLVNPTWFNTGIGAVIPAGSPENILGSRWLGLSAASYGIHGTTDPQSLGKQVTQGCVRMSNPDVEELYTIVPVGTEVTIVD